MTFVSIGVLECWGQMLDLEGVPKIMEGEKLETPDNDTVEK